MPIYKIGDRVRDLCQCEAPVLIKEIEPRLNGDDVGYLVQDEDGAEVWRRESDLSF